jgi:hypothetical protein
VAIGAPLANAESIERGLGVGGLDEARVDLRPRLVVFVDLVPDAADDQLAHGQALAGQAQHERSLRPRTVASSQMVTAVAMAPSRDEGSAGGVRAMRGRMLAPTQGLAPAFYAQNSPDFR